MYYGKGTKMKDERLKRSFEVCKQCEHYSNEFKTLFCGDKVFMACEIDAFAPRNGEIIVKIASNKSEYQKYLVPKECPCWTDQCIANWNK